MQEKGQSSGQSEKLPTEKQPTEEQSIEEQPIEEQPIEKPAADRSAMLGTMEMKRLVPKISVPIMFSMLVQALYNVVDSIFISRYDPNGLTSVSLAFPFQMLMIALGVGMGTAIVCLLRFVCSFLSGYIVWKDYDYAFEWLNNFGWAAHFTETMGENALCWFYSLIYNATYMLPETVLTVIGVVILWKTAPKLFEKR